MRTASDWIRDLDLVPHPEGGYFREVYRSDEDIPSQGLPERYHGARSFATSIYFLLDAGQVSRIHRLASDETWHFYTGSSLNLHILDTKPQVLRLGPNPGEAYQVLVPRGAWFGMCLAPGGTFALVGCSMAPGFTYADFELGNREELLHLFPGQAKVIRTLTQDVSEDKREE
jgi:predicted cupin superfamily sugar epimerase